MAVAVERANVQVPHLSVSACTRMRAVQAHIRTRTHARTSARVHTHTHTHTHTHIQHPTHKIHARMQSYSQFNADEVMRAVIARIDALRFKSGTNDVTENAVGPSCNNTQLLQAGSACMCASSARKPPPPRSCEVAGSLRAVAPSQRPLCIGRPGACAPRACAADRLGQRVQRRRGAKAGTTGGFMPALVRRRGSPECRGSLCA